jgi:quinol monooxygenase YgiN
MPAISINNDVATAIALYFSTSKNQQEIIDILIASVETLKQQSGFISFSIHKSQDGLRVATYEQWHNQADYEAFLNSAAGKALSAKISAFPAESHLFEIVTSQSISANHVPPKIITGGFITHFAEFRTTPENQPRLVELEKEYIVKAFENNTGLVSANFHRSLDGLMTINYGQWISQEAFNDILRSPGFESTGSGYWVGLAENEFHLYDVVFTEPAEENN